MCGGFCSGNPGVHIANLQSTSLVKERRVDLPGDQDAFLVGTGDSFLLQALGRDPDGDNKNSGKQGRDYCGKDEDGYGTHMMGRHNKKMSNNT